MSATDLEAAKQPYPQRRFIVNAILYPPIQKTSRVEIDPTQSIFSGLTVRWPRENFLRRYRNAQNGNNEHPTRLAS